MNNPPNPNTAIPATPIPITDPPVKETFSALARLVRAACVVLTFALVAILIPTYPANADKKAPSKNESAIRGCDSSTSVPDQPNNIAEKTAKYASIFHSALRNAIAPFAMNPANSLMFASPASCLVTQADLIAMAISPIAPSAGMRYTILFIIYLVRNLVYGKKPSANTPDG